jgi:hypothetical protein
VWRELRRISGGASGVTEQAREAADAADWASFTARMESDASQPNGYALDLFRVWSDKPGAYGDPIGFVVQGVKVREGTVITRNRTWEIEWQPKSQVGTDRTLQ